MHHVSVPVVLLLAGCNPKVRAAFEATFDEVLAPPAPLADDWAPDAVLRVSPQLLADLVTTPLAEAPLAAGLDLGGVPTSVAVGLRDVVIDLPDTPCACVAVDAVVDGTLDVHAGGAVVALPLTGALRADLEIAPDPDPGGVSVLARKALVAHAEARFAEYPARPLSALPLAPASDWLGDAVPDVRVASFGGPWGPVRAVRVDELWPGLRLDVRTAARTERAAAAPPAPAEGWAARIDAGTVLDLARRTSFRVGPVVHGHWVDPRRLELAEGWFTVDVRIWKPRSYWQDWRVSGPLVLRDGVVRFEPERLDALGASRERVPATDPLLALQAAGLGAQLEAAVAATLPRNGPQTVTPWRVVELRVDDGDLLLRGGALAEPGADVSARR